MHLGIFITSLRRATDRQTLQRGWDYYQRRRVGQAGIMPDGRLEARVMGTESYTVTLGLDVEGMWSDCTCPASKWSDVCKHVVALAYHADEEGFSSDMLAWLQESEGYPADVAARADAPEEPIPPPQPSWQARFAELEQGARERRDATEADTPARPAAFEIWIDADMSRQSKHLALNLVRRASRASGGFSKPKPAKWRSLDEYRTLDGPVRAVLRRIAQAADNEPMRWRWYDDATILITPRDAVHAMRTADGTVTVRCLGEDDGPGESLVWSDEPWQFTLVVKRTQPNAEAGDNGPAMLHVEGALRRGEDRRTLDTPRLLLSGGIVVFEDGIAPLDAGQADDWIRTLRKDGPLTARAQDLGVFLPQLLDAALGVPIDLGDLAVPAQAPVGTLDLSLPPGKPPEVSIKFDYGHTRVSATEPKQHMILKADERQGGQADEPVGLVLQRNAEAERLLLETFAGEGGTRNGPDWLARPYRLPPEDLASRCGRLMEAGWQIHFDSRPLRTGGAFSMQVKSGIDWFNLEGGATFDASALTLPEILRAVGEGRRIVTLDDGGAALLPPEWIARLEALGALAGRVSQKDGVRIARARAPLLDILLGDLGDVQTDATFDKLRGALRRFDGIKPRVEPRNFHGELRAYQREALGWLAFLRSAGLGGCLADDMGLGKTVQVLASLLTRRRAKDRTGPSLVVAPRSVLSNWVREAGRFAPSLRTAVYHGPERADVLADLDNLDLIVTTYGTMRNDILVLKEIPFDYAILDESQAIKNSTSKTARAARLLQATHRLALSGTPIENHLEELGSLFQFLNPGLLGTKGEFKTLMGKTGTPSPERLAWLQAAIRPVILRRTREEVLTELPEKTEQILRCPLGIAQRQAYDGIREHYRASVLSKVEQSGLAKSKMHVLEALLRLRQAACHPGLIDKARRGDDAAKLDRLIPMLTEIADAGHKALVFSQFTSFLSIVRERLDDAGVKYEYMDGRTRKRQACIDRFQEDPDLSAFLISLKAGGTGLNLTAAQYVFLLDPWWNPAVEAQAIGRAHRMGQQNPVTVYRLIGEDTVEDRVLELQDRKRELVKAVLGGVSDASLRDITQGDLERLLA